MENKPKSSKSIVNTEPSSLTLLKGHEINVIYYYNYL